jgi:2-methylisocitrate lyase-like PEP mutase family enzyme
MMKPAAVLRAKMSSGRTAVAIGAYDAFSARIVEASGFDAVYVGSYATEAALLGKPDLALMSKTERLWIARNVCKAVSIPVIVDAEEGYGNAISVMDTVRDFEAAGAAGIHLDDETLPSKCPFLPGIPHNTLISTDEMCGKIEAAVKARTDPDFLIVARSDVIGTVPREEYYAGNKIKEVVERSNAYAAAGADAIFVMALNEDELGYFAREIRAPLVGIFATAEPLPIAAFEQAGYPLTIGSLVGIYAAGKGLVRAMRKLRETRDWNAIRDEMIDDQEFFQILGVEQYQSCYRDYRIQ